MTVVSRRSHISQINGRINQDNRHHCRLLNETFYQTMRINNYAINLYDDIFYSNRTAADFCGKFFTHKYEVYYHMLVGSSASLVAVNYVMLLCYYAQQHKYTL